MDVTAVTSSSHNALTILCQYYPNDNLLDCVRLLLRRGIDVRHCVKDTKKANGRNALYLLCENYIGKYLIDIVRILWAKDLSDESFDAVLNSAPLLRKRGSSPEAEILDNMIASYCSRQRPVSIFNSNI